MNDVLEVWGLASLILTLVVNILFALGVYSHAMRIEDNHPSELQFVSAFVWSAATLAGGVFVATAYWVIHCSAISRRPLG